MKSANVFAFIAAWVDDHPDEMIRVLNLMAADARKRDASSPTADRIDSLLLRAQRKHKELTDPSRPKSFQAVRDRQSRGPQDFLLTFEPEESLDRLILPRRVLRTVGNLIAEQKAAAKLRDAGMEPRHRVLLAGPPGNGKTSLASAIAAALGVPLHIVSYEGIIGSYLGESAQRLGRIFDRVRSQPPSVLFFDEFDTIGKERGDTHETGEIKRVVSTLLMQVDALPSHVLMIVATNHPELLDRAAWRRFEVRLELPPPTPAQVGRMFESLADRIRKLRHRLAPEKHVHEPPFGNYDPEGLAARFAGESFSEVELFCQDLERRLVLDGLENRSDLVRAVLSERADRYRPESPRERP